MYPTYIDKLFKLNSKLLRILEYKGTRSHVPDLYFNYNTLPITLLHEQQLLILGHKIIYSPETVPELFVDYLSKNESVHPHTRNTRTKDNMHLFGANTGYGLRCLKYKIAKLWHELDTELKEETSPAQFKSLLKLVLTIKLYSDY